MKTNLINLNNYLKILTHNQFNSINAEIQLEIP